MIVDGLIVSDELDLLEARLRYLDRHVDLWIVCEADTTHQGEAKPLWFAESSAARWRPWLDRIIHVPVGLPAPGGPRGGVGTDWYSIRERAHRSAIARGWNGLPDDALVCVSDVDEIPVSTALRIADEELAAGTVAAFEMDMYVWDARWRHPQAWLGTACARLATALALTSDLPETGPAQAMRDLRGAGAEPFPHAGWHLSWTGGLDGWRRKLVSFSHAELAGVDLEGCARTGLDVNGIQMVEAVDHEVPAALLEAARR